MTATKITTWKTGVLYLMMGIPAAFSLYYIPSRFIVAADATATVNNITESEFIYRLAILAMLISQISFLLLALSLYNLFKDVNIKQVRLLLTLVVVGVAIELVNCFNLIAPLTILSNSEFLSAFSKPQRDTFVLAFLQLFGGGHIVVTAFWGLWLLPFGNLTIRSGFFPRILGILLILAGVPYLLNSFTSIIWPAQTHFVTRITMPLMLGEIPMLIWLLFKGAKVPIREERPANLR